MKIKILIMCLLILLFSNTCLADLNRKSGIIDMALLTENNSILPTLIASKNLKMIYYNNYFNYYKSHNISLVDMNDDKFMGDLSLSFYYAQFVSKSVLSGLQYIKKDSILAHYKKTGVFPFRVASDFTIIDYKGNSCVLVCIRSIDQKRERKVYIDENKKQVVHDGKYVFYFDDENLLNKYKSDISLNINGMDDYIKIIKKMNGYSFIINNDSPYKIFNDENIPKYKSNALCIGKDEKGYFMGFALLYNTDKEAAYDVQFIDNIIRGKLLLTILGKRLSDFYAIEKELVFRENNVLFGKIYQINNEHGRSFWKDTVLKKDYLF